LSRICSRFEALAGQKSATGGVVNWLTAEFDGEALHLLPGEPES
jgi:hypothetical protein